MSLKPYEILEEITNILSHQFPEKTYNSFPKNIVNIPFEDELILLDVYSGSDIKTIISINIFIPRSFGPIKCKERAQKIEELVKKNRNRELKEITTLNIDFDVPKNAYVQKMKIVFEKSADEFAMKIGGDEIKISKETTLNFSRNVSIYYSPFDGATQKDLGKSLKKVDVKAKVNKNQLEKLIHLANSGKPESIEIENQKFNATLTSLCARLNGNVSFTFLESSP